MIKYSLSLTLDTVKAHVIDGIDQSSWSANNRDRLNSCTKDGYSGDSFYGANWESSKRQLIQGVDNFDEWLKSAQLRAPVRVESRRRRRFYNDVSGECSYDRRWDDRPYEDIRKEKVQSHNIRLYVMADFNGGVRAASIQQYGIKIFELLNAIETSGRNVELALYYYDSGVYNNMQENIWTEVLIKKSGEYVQPQVLATCLTPFFFRRFMFQEWVIWGAQNKWEMSSGFGRAMRFKQNIVTVEDNCVYIENGNPDSFNEELFAKTLKEILEKM